MSLHLRNKLTQIPDGDGGYLPYRRLSARLPEFLKEYPPKAGFRVEFTVTDLLSQQKGYLELLKTLFAIHLRPGDVGLPSLESIVNTFVCEAKLLDPENRIIRTASARSEVRTHKDHEKLETAALQRMLASLGFGGEIFDDDEDAAVIRERLASPAESTHQEEPGAHINGVVPVSVPQINGTASAASVAPPSMQSANASDAVVAQSGADSGHPPVAPTCSPNTPVSPGQASRKRDEVSPALRKQVENQAKRLGRPVPKMATKQDAEAALSDLGEVQRQRRRSGIA